MNDEQSHPHTCTPGHDSDSPVGCAGFYKEDVEAAAAGDGEDMVAGEDGPREDEGLRVDGDCEREGPRSKESWVSKRK